MMTAEQTAAYQFLKDRILSMNSKYIPRGAQIAEQQRQLRRLDALVKFWIKK